MSALLGFRSQPGIHPDTPQLNWWIHAWRKSSEKSLGFHKALSRTTVLRCEGLIFPGSNGFEPQQVDAAEHRARTRTPWSAPVAWIVKHLKLNCFPTAVTIHRCLYSLAFEVLRSDVVLVRELGVPPLALDSTPYGADGAAVALTLSADTRCRLGCRLRAVHEAFLCRPRQEVLFHSLKNGSGCQVWTLHYWWSHGLHDAQNMVIVVLWCNCQHDYSIIFSASHLQHPPKIQNQNKCQTLC